MAYIIISNDPRKFYLSVWSGSAWQIVSLPERLPLILPDARRYKTYQGADKVIEKERGKSPDSVFWQNAGYASEEDIFPEGKEGKINASLWIKERK